MIFGRTVSSLLLLAIHGAMASAGFAQDQAASAETTQSGDAETTSWRDHYTFGPGDVVNISFYGKPELDRSGLRIAPDGTLSYLQANSVQVSGLTIDGIRQKYESILAKYFRNIRLIVTPAEIASKRYIILGKVIDKGVFVLDRPMTILEAIARSRGIETGLYEQQTIEIADMDRSFIVRGGERLPVDLGALYYRGDLSQNISLEPNDYIYIASSLTNEFYVLGEVNTPGAQGLVQNMTVVGAITRREGFTDRAWRERVLLVRGSIGDPQVKIINVKDILQGRQSDVLIEPSDIIYVSDNPWTKVEDILDGAIMDYIRSATTSWVGTYVPAITEKEWLPDPNWNSWPWQD